jgi:hypothetical protein
MSYQYLLTGRAEQGAVMYGLADSSPWLTAHVKEFAFPILRGWIAEKLAPDVLDAAIARGRALPLDETLKAIIGELRR